MSENDRPRVSVLLPVFDAGHTLAACLRSIQRQREARFECVAVDDGSRDESLALLQRFAERDPRFRAISTPHRGLVEALNHGLERCRADFVARMDADDVMHRDRLAAQLEAFADDPTLAALGSHVRLFPRRNLGPGQRAYEAWLNDIDSPERVRAEAFVECPVAHPSLTIRREIALALRYRDRGWPEDYDLVLRLLAGGARVGVVARRLHGWRETPGRLSRAAPTYAIARFTACKAAFLAQAFLSRVGQYVLWGYGGTGKALRRALLEHGKRPGWIVELHPGRLGTRIHGARVIPPEELPRVPRAPIVVSVAGASARSEIRESLARMGFEETRDYYCAA